jgi:arginyl-tRNA synthetase
MKQELEQKVAAAIKALFEADVAVELTRPEEQYGDYATNVALQLAKPLGKPPREIAEALAAKLKEGLAEQVSEVTVAGPGFINLTLSDKALLKAAEAEPAKSLAGKVVVAEYSDPNPFKVLHAGHLYTSVVGDAVANLLEQAGAKVHRVNFGGDVGLHVGKTMWAIIKELGGEHPEKLNDMPKEEGPEWLTERYIEGVRAYAFGDEAVRSEIMELNKHIYQIHTDNDKDSPLAKIYWLTRDWSYQYFETFYDLIGSKFEKYYPESETASIGLETVRKHIGDVYQESDGAVIFDGEKHGLHTRVFINSEGLPTYEAKDVGLVIKKWEDYKFDKSVVITGNDIIEYMKVVLKSIEQFKPELAQRSQHLTHGIVKLAGGRKMSSREGTILRAIDVLNTTAAANKALSGDNNQETVLGAVKYAFLKNRIGGDIVYDPQESVSLEGHSGPYLQYAHARARSILRKAGQAEHQKATELETGERALVRKLSEYPEAVDQAVAELAPHHLANYLYELAQTFNRFYEQNRVIGDKRQGVRLGLIDKYAATLKNGLSILGISAPENM